MSRLVSAEDIRSAVVAAGIKEVQVRECSICGSKIGYIVAQGQLFYDGSCDCTNIGSLLQPRSFKEIADTLNKLSYVPKFWESQAAKWGIK